MGRLASQTATQKLGQILGLLVIPILVLWIAYFVHAKRNIDTLTLGLQAVQQTQTGQESGISRQQLTVMLAAAGVAFQSDLQSNPLAENTFIRLPQLFQKRDGARSNSQIDANQKSTLKFEIATLLDQLKTQFSEQRGLLWRNVIVLTVIGFICSFVSIGLSVLMMRSTIRQLDAVEHAKLEAQVARREAEQVALRFTTINSDISNLNQELASKIKALGTAQDELLRKNRIEQLGQLTATIAHEIRNPLGAIRTSIFMLERRASKAGLEVGELIERINNSVNRCDSIISQLHDYAQIKEPNNSELKLDDWLSKIIREEASRLPPDIFIECSLGLGDIQLSFDPSQLQRAVVNLLNNACEALQNESQKDPHSKRKHIWVTTLHDKGHVVIRVSDNGPGIAAEHFSRIREPLFTTKSFGSGLGLPVVEQIVNLQGGHLEIAANIGGGAKISIHLPSSIPQGASNAA